MAHVMDNLGVNLGVASFNVNGINSKAKRVKIFEWLKLKQETVFFLQETHSTPQVEQEYAPVWGRA